MRYDDELYKVFLEQMQDLENFRMAYESTHPFAGLDRDDPDVKRLMEAMGFFSARTHRAGMRNIIASHLRIFQQLFSYVLTPLPSMAMMKASPTGHFVETMVLPKKSEIAVRTSSGAEAVFSTLGDLRILPIAMTEAHMASDPGGGSRMVFKFAASYPRNDEIGMLRLYINHLNNYPSSSGVLFALEKHITNASVAFGHNEARKTAAEPCHISFGDIQPDDRAQWLHPIQNERLFFHYPQQEMYINIQVPPPPRNWQHFSVCLELTDKWPQNLVLKRDIFHLFTTPIINLTRSMAQPIYCQGMKERHLLVHPNLENNFEVHSLRGVYQLEEDGPVPVRSGMLSGGKGSYELDQAKDRSGRHLHWLSLNYPQAVETPRTICADAYWLQPAFSQSIQQKMKLTPYHHSIDGVNWEIVGSPVPHAENQYGAHLDNYLLLLSLNNRSILSMEDLMCLMNAMGCTATGAFKEICDLITDVRVETGPGRPSQTAAPYHLIYFIFVRNMTAGAMPLAHTFMRHLEKILDAWISEAGIEVRMEVSKERHET